MYAVEFSPEALDQAAALPPAVRDRLLELVELIELDPWSAPSYNREDPDANMRAHVLDTGDAGPAMVVYLILDDQRRVIVLRVVWAG